ncbi:AAA family ATPase [bacterium]|nr:AAA family ATPase [bacterium]
MNKTAEQRIWEKECMMSLQDLREYKPDPDDKILGNNLITRGGLTLLVGPADIGKTTIYFQLALAMLMKKKKWLEKIEIHQRRFRILVFQTENNAERMQRETRRGLGKKLFFSNRKLSPDVKFYNPRTIQDRTIADPETCEHMKECVKNFNPDLVIFDPYRDFFVGNSENAAIETRDTVYKIMEIAQAANPKTATLIVHHSLTGQASRQKAYGLEANEYGRGSKVLMSMARCQINCAPNSDVLGKDMVLVCAKNNDGPKFEPFGLKRNLKTKLFELDETFDPHKWKNSQRRRNRTAVEPKVSIEIVTSILNQAGGSMTKKKLTDAIREKTKCSSSTAYDSIKHMLASGVLKPNEGSILAS